MAKLKLSGFLLMMLALLLISSISPALADFPANTLFTEDLSSNLYTLNASTWAGTLVGPIGVSQVSDINFVGSNLYGVTIPMTPYPDPMNPPWSALYSINPATGAGTKIGDITGYYGVNALGTSPTGILWGADDNTGDVFTINQATGAPTVIGNLGNGIKPAGDLAFQPGTGTLYAAVYSSGAPYPNPPTYIATVNQTTGAASLLPNLTGFNGVFGLSFKDGIMYGADVFGNLFTVDPATGIGTFVGMTNVGQWGLTTSPDSAVPLPSTILLLSSGLAGLAGLGWKRRKS